ncbi:MAG: TonB-dependent receptor [Halieaceae bacterium]|jgi:outer membrane receptor protein involved in Fe transport|nr:TonB-dependent receptor [Halieaceae bacterium]
MRLAGSAWLSLEAPISLASVIPGGNMNCLTRPDSTASATAVPDSGPLGPSHRAPFARAGLCSALAAALASLPTADASAQEPDRIEEIYVIATALSSGDLDPGRLPYAVQSFSAEDLDQPGYYSVVDLLRQRAGSITANDAQNNRLQPDIQFRGFTASPLLGLSQGVAIYQNGARINEVFGDTVNWDLLPTSSFESMNLVAGSNPVYGLNAIGGALTLRTKTGFSSEGGSLDLTAGSYGSRDIGFTQGGNNGNWGYFIAFESMEEDGWRDFSESEAANAYGSISWRAEKQELDLFLNIGDTSLRGNGAVPLDLLRADRTSVFTHPDATDNELTQVSVSYRYFFDAGTELSVSGFSRQLEVNSFNGDGTEFEECGEDDDDDDFDGMDSDTDMDGEDEDDEFEGFLCHDEDGPVQDLDGQLVAEDFNAINNRSRREQDSLGFTLQLLLNRDWGGVANQAVFGIDYFYGETDFSSSVEFSRLTEQRGTTLTGRFYADGFVTLQSELETFSVFASDAISISDRLTLTLSGRFNGTHVDNVDPSGLNPALEGSHHYERLNGGIGLQYDTSDRTAFYTSVQQSSRTPTPVELACSEPDAPCNLPNSFLADPPLDDVVARSFELGIRGSTEYLSAWRVGMFYTLSQNDILFQTTGGVSSSEGFFENAADTLRQGVELELAGGMERFSWYLNYSFLAATYDDPFVSSSPNNPAAEDGRLLVASGSDIPGLPDHNVKFGAATQALEWLTFGVDFRGASGVYLRGDEANVDAKTDEWFVTDLYAAVALGDHFRIEARVDNLFDEEYETFGLYGEADEVLEDVEDESGRFLGPAAPRFYWLTLSADW